MDFVNDNAHAIRVGKPQQGAGDKLVRILPGEVVAASGEYADRLKVTTGVRTAEDGDRDRWEQLRAERATTTTDSPAHSRVLVDAGLEVAVSLRRALVAAPLQRVIGDDTAPYGPPSGTISTKLDVVAAADSEREREAFAAGEAILAGPVEGAGLPDPAMPAATSPSSGEVHNAQLEAQRDVNEVARETQVPETHAPAGNGEPTEPIEPPYDHNVEDLLGEVERRQAEGREIEIVGTGQGGNVKKSDIVDALEADDKALAEAEAT